MIIVNVNGRNKYFPEITDFPYASTLAPEAQKNLKSELELKLEKFYRQRKYIAMMLAKKDKISKKAA